jgi:transcriptional regulator with XRE-family HTH domain
VGYVDRVLAIRQSDQVAIRKRHQKRAAAASLELMGLPERLRYAMSHPPITGKELSDASGVSASVITRIRNGERIEGVTADTILKLARGLGRDPAWLLMGAEMPFADQQAANALRSTIRNRS